ncbi:MAG: hypothetical protein NT062_01015, partial [Proteobacteria bacterium]|nr:hypothetical protein [Pseudomonadota bacterium]
MRWPVAPGGSARDRTTRAAIVVELRTDDPRRGGLGEAAPLPGVSRDSLDDCARALDAFAATLPIEVANLDEALAAAAPIAAPAARFAIETALLALLDHRIAGDLPIAFVVDTVDEARAAIAAGAACLKLKIAPDRLAHVFAIAAACPGVPLRLDANRTFARADVPALVARLAGLPIEFLEEPCVDPPSIGGIALALDETLVDDPAAPADVHVLKPTVLGGLGACFAHARARGVASVVVTHALEGPIGSTAVARVARMIASPRAAGIAPHPALDAWPLAIVDDRPVDDALRAIDGALAARAPLAIVRDAAQRALAEALAVPAGTAFVLFTSGSTGAPQPVVLARATVDAAIAASAAHLGWRDDDRWLLALSVAHTGGLAIVARCRDARRPAVPLVGDLARALVDERITL